MNDTRIVRNEKRITATAHNAAELVKLQKEVGSFQGYLDPFGKDDERLMTDVQGGFQRLGQSTARAFLWSAGCELTPTAEEKKWRLATSRGNRFPYRSGLHENLNSKLGEGPGRK